MMWRERSDTHLEEQCSLRGFQVTFKESKDLHAAAASPSPLSYSLHHRHRTDGRVMIERVAESCRRSPSQKQPRNWSCLRKVEVFLASRP